MATTRLYLDRRARAKDGKGSIIITLFHNNSTASFPTGVRIYPEQWNGSKVIKHPNADSINVLLANKKLCLDKKLALLFIDDYVNTLTATEVKAKVKEPVPGKRPEHLVSDIFHEYMSKPMKDGTREIYKAALNKVTLFGGEQVKIEAINTKWLYNFEQFLARSQGPNGRAIYFRCLRAVCSYAYKIRVLASYPFANFKFKTEPTRKRSVEADVFREFLEYPAGVCANRYRDYFLLSFLLIGINIKDLLLATRAQVVNGRLEYIRNKTHKRYSIKIEPEAQELIDKYAGETYMLEAMEHCQHHKSFARAINEACQLIGPKAVVKDEIFGDETEVVQPIIPGITTYYARHCWATFAYEIGIPIDIISQALGHSMGNRTTLIYIKPDQSKVDSANRKVIDWILHHRGP